MPDFDWLKLKHPIYTAQQKSWRREERRLFGGDPALGELHRFDWETHHPTRNVLPHQEGKAHYKLRQDAAVYMNFPDLFAKILVGHLFRKAPTPDDNLDFGTLGTVRRDRTSNTPNQAELVWTNADGIGNDGSQWDNFWGAEMRRAMATGHRWLLVDSTTLPPENRADEIRGLRPYLVGLSPLSVLNWYYDAGKLAFAVLETSQRNPQLTEKGELEGNDPVKGWILMVAEGWTGFGSAYAGGGWWKFDEETELIDEAPWQDTGGDIPMFPLFYERAEDTEQNPTMSRSGTMELGQAAVAYMNLGSAADFDAWDAAQSLQYLVGIDAGAYNAAMELLEKGSKLIPLEANKRTGTNPTVVDGSTGAVTAEVFEKRMERKLQEVRDLAALEAAGDESASGAAKERGFADVKSPRLALMASEMEQAQNTAIQFLERRFSGAERNPTGSVVWPREFDLSPVVDSVREVFELMTISGTSSPTLTSKSIVKSARMKGLVTQDDEAAQIEQELRGDIESAALESSRAAASAAEVEAALRAAAGVETEETEPVLA